MDKLPLVFAGFGISAPQAGYDDYAGLDVSGKAVIIFTHEPQESDPNSPLNGNRPMPESTLYRKAEIAHNRGARVLLVVSDPSHATDQGLFHSFEVLPDADEAGMPVLRVRRNEMQPLLDAWGLDALAIQINRDLRPRSKAAEHGERRLHRVSRPRSTPRPQCRGHHARVGPGKGGRSDRHWRPLRPRRPRRPACR